MEQEFTTLKNHNQYEISIDEPWLIRRKCDGYILNIWLDKKIGYFRVCINRKSHLLHRVIGEQFIENPENLPDIDHINRIRTDNRIDNLRWVSRELNRHNRISHKGIKYEYVSELPNGYEAFTEYDMVSGEKRQFNNLSYKMENNQPQFLTNDSEQHYRILHENINKNVCHHVRYNDVKGKGCSICFNRISKAPQPISTTTTTTETTTITTAEETRTTTKTTTTTTKYQTETSDEEYEPHEPDDEDYHK
jgi:hypothetical protein